MIEADVPDPKRCVYRSPGVAASSVAKRNRACFPAGATVQTRGGSRVSMSDIRVGDEVSVGNGHYSRVFMFTHQTAGGAFPFVRLTSAAGPALTASDGHLAYIAGELRPVDEARVGDELVLADGTRTTVAKIERVELPGLYNPQTEHGDIAVDGVVASCYTTAVPASAAHSLLAPLRTLAAVCLAPLSA